MKFNETQTTALSLQSSVYFGMKGNSRFRRNCPDKLPETSQCFKIEIPIHHLLVCVLHIAKTIMLAFIMEDCFRVMLAVVVERKLAWSDDNLPVPDQEGKFTVNIQINLR